MITKVNCNALYCSTFVFLDEQLIVLLWVPFSHFLSWPLKWSLRLKHNQNFVVGQWVIGTQGGLIIGSMLVSYDILGEAILILTTMYGGIIYQMVFIGLM